MNLLRRLFGRRPEQRHLEQLGMTLLALFQTHNEAEARLLIQDHPEILSSEAQRFVEDLIRYARARGDAENEAILSEWYARLHALRAESIGQIHVDKTHLGDTSLTEQGNTAVAPPGFEADVDKAIRLQTRIQYDPQSVDLLIQVYEGILGRLRPNEHSVFRAAIQYNVGLAYEKRVCGDRAENLERAIECYQKALEVYTQQAFPGQWAKAQTDLALAYQSRVQGDRAGNLERAIELYQKTLEVYTQQAFPEDWAITHNYLALAYDSRVRGDRAENMEFAIGCCQRVLASNARDLFPNVWAATQTGLANVYRNRIQGDRAGNLEHAIECCQKALEVYTRDTFPELWAINHCTLGRTYETRICGDRAENLERAIECYQKAVEVDTQQVFPERWAMVQKNLADAYRTRIRGDRAENLERAIECYQKALEVYSQQAFPEDWAAVKNGLAITYRSRIRGNRAENLECAVECCRKALEVYSQQAFPKEWATVQNSLATSYLGRVRGDRAENLECAIECCQRALAVNARDTFLEPWAINQSNLGLIYENRIRGDRAENLECAIECHQKALEVYTQQAYPGQWAKAQTHLALAYQSRVRGDRAENLERAIELYQKALEIYTQRAFPEDWAITQNNLADAYQSRVRGDRGENLAYAVELYRRALEICTQDAFPAWHRLIAHNLGNLLFTERHWSDAIEAYQTALEAGLILYQTAATPETREAELTAISGLPARLAFCLVYVGQMQAAVEVIEQGRARSLAEALMLNDAPLDHLTLQDKAAFETTRSYLHDLQAETRLPEDTPSLTHSSSIFDTSSGAIVSRALALPREQTPKQRDFLNLSNELRDQSAELRQIIDRVNSYVPEFFPEIAFAKIQVLAQNAPLVYIVTTPTNGVALIVCPNGVERVWFDLTEGDVVNLLGKIEGRDRASGYLPAQFGEASLTEALDDILPRLGEKVMQPVAEALKSLGVSDVTLIPCGRLALFPLHAAEYQIEGQVRRFMDEFTVTYTPSARALGSCRDALSVIPAQARTLCGVGNPLPLLEGVTPLTYARSEVEEIAQLFGGAATILYEHRATRGALETQLGHTTYMHLSCHGTFNAQDPLQSGVVLSNGEMLTLRDMLGGQRLRGTRLVVLSACQTAITDFKDLPEEAIGLPGGFVQAGVPGVVGTLWSVNDLSTMLLMVKFYEAHLKEGLAPAAALRKAQLWLRDVTNSELSELFAKYKLTATDRPTSTRMAYEVASEKFREYTLRDPNERPYAHPYYWAPFVFYGV
jgi:CHAT domain-containing protein/tetratricopeptide (TPR) repeat protein